MTAARLSVLVIDSDSRRRAALAQAVNALGGHATARASSKDIGSSPEARFDVAIVEVANAAGADDAQLGALARSLLAREATLICHSAGLLGWPLGDRCSLLLLGASVLLDSREPAFEKELDEELTRSLQRRRRLCSDQRLLEAMRGVGMVGESPPMLRLFQLIVRFAPLSDLPVLVTGETGTGKEVVVNAIHRLDTKRAGCPFIAVNCAALPKAIAEAELFGHRRGAFSGAESHRLGLVRAADGGTLFLDEVGDLDLELQAKLLRVLQERCVLSVGEDREVPVDVRIMAATHRDLAARAVDGQFRQDLYHRLAVLPLHVPPLRERPEDIPLLVRHFAGKHAHLRPEGLPAIAAEFVEALSTANLPGNVRQLENILRSVLARRDHDRALGLGDLPRDILAEMVRRQQSGADAAGADAAGADFTAADAPAGDEVAPDSAAQHAACAVAAPGSTHPSSGLPSSALAAPRHAGQKLADALFACERAAVESALVVAKGNQVNAARLLGISTRSVYTKMRKHRLDGRPRSSSSAS